MAVKSWIALLFMTGLMQAPGAESGDDLLAPFARAHAGRPLRFVAIGGSITQAGSGWVGPWLRERFPAAAVSAVNAGMSATGSELAMFRLERDVIAHQPDLVALEFCVNDQGSGDEQILRSMETLVVRLAGLPSPPAVIVVEAASRHGVDVTRHRRVAAHYGVPCIDLQRAVAERIAAGATWESLFSDDVHPIEAGHALYAEAIAGALAPFVERARRASVDAPRVLPSRLSRLPLLLDARLVPLSTIIAPGWGVRDSRPVWWSRFFTGLLVADAPGTRLTLTLPGTTLGLLYAMENGAGSCFVTVDGGAPRHLATGTRDGYANVMLAEDLPPGEHRLEITLPAAQPDAPGVPRNGSVGLGYALVAGAGPTPGTAPAPSEPSTALNALRFEPLPASAWSMYGPLPAGSGRDAGGAIGRAALPGGDARWTGYQGEGAWLNLGAAGPTMAYASANLASADDRTALCAIAADYFARVWIDGEPVLDLDRGHGPPQEAVLFPVRLRRGDNRIVVALGSGSGGFGFALSVSQP
ncbi:MAG: lysophospholipase [Planctomycetes bacterium]|nr:lysophospholipase [Planctomycetota bacterium]